MPRRFRTLPIGCRPVILQLPLQRLLCLDCGRTAQVRLAFADERRSYTHAFERYVLELSRMATIQDIARHLRVSWDIVRDIQKRHLIRRWSRPRLKDLKHIAIDEISVGRGHRYLTVVLDLDSGAVVFVGQGKGADSLGLFWKRLRASHARVTAVATDMSPAYTLAVAQHLPKAIHVFDRFQDYLLDFPGALLFVTHNRTFLSALATRIIDLDRGTLTSWPGNYASYLQKKAAAEEADVRALDRLDKKLAAEEAWLRQGVKARRTRNEGRVRALLALRSERAALRAAGGEVHLTVDATESSGRVVFEADRVSKSFDGVPVVRDYTHRILRADRIGLVGPNGSGKTTLLKLLVGELKPDSGTVVRGARVRIAYFDQQRDELDPEQSVADSVRSRCCVPWRSP